MILYGPISTPVVNLFSALTAPIWIRHALIKVNYLVVLNCASVEQETQGQEKRREKEKVSLSSSIYTLCSSDITGTSPASKEHREE